VEHTVRVGADKRHVYQSIKPHQISPYSAQKAGLIRPNGRPFATGSRPDLTA